MLPLSLYAGKTALKRIQKEGLTANMFSAFLGASGGPKWFVLTGLDKVIFNEFMHKSVDHVDIIGSSVGAFRANCFAQDDPASAITRLADAYSTTVYSEKPSLAEVTQKGEAILKHMMGDNGVQEVLASRLKSTHIVLARCHGLTQYENKLKQLSGLSLAAARNLRGRKYLAKSFTRTIFSTSQTNLSFSEKTPISTEYAQITEENFLQALMASGSIPAVIKGVQNIKGVSNGMFRDGGIIDYHFDMKINTPNLVLYPHFYSKPIPGWFDKSIKSRSCHADSYDNVLLMAPSDEFVKSLPTKKIPDRADFKDLSSQERIKNWNTVIAESERLAEAFLQVVDASNPSQYIKPINLQR